MRMGHRLLFAIARDRAVRQLVADHGVDAAKAEALVAHVTDERVLSGMAATGVLFDGSILSALWQWVQTHPETIQKILQIILSVVLPLLAA